MAVPVKSTATSVPQYTADVTKVTSNEPKFATVPPPHTLPQEPQMPMPVLQLPTPITSNIFPNANDGAVSLRNGIYF